MSPLRRRIHPPIIGLFLYVEIWNAERCLPMKAYIMIKIRSGEVKAVVSQLRKLPSIQEAHMTFGPYDAVAEVEAADLATLGQITALEVQPIYGVEQTLTCLTVDV